MLTYFEKQVDINIMVLEIEWIIPYVGEESILFCLSGKYYNISLQFVCITNCCNV